MFVSAPVGGIDPRSDVRVDSLDKVHSTRGEAGPR
jgi:hypothetical protein